MLLDFVVFWWRKIDDAYGLMFKQGGFHDVQKKDNKDTKSKH